MVWPIIGANITSLRQARQCSRRGPFWQGWHGNAGVMPTSPYLGSRRLFLPPPLSPASLLSSANAGDRRSGHLAPFSGSYRDDLLTLDLRPSSALRRGDVEATTTWTSSAVHAHLTSLAKLGGIRAEGAHRGRYPKECLVNCRLRVPAWARKNRATLGG
jgi:hypothetical protein